MNSHGGLTFGTRAREIARDEIRLAVDKARAIPLPSDREILHLLPQDFILDDQGGVHDPLGMMAMRLEVRVHMVTAAASATQNVVTAVNRAGVQVDDTVFEPLACADAVLRNDERELGVCLVDVGAGSTSLIVFQEGAVIHTAVIPIGGDHFTSDLSVGLCTPLVEAEKIKKIYGNVVVTLVPEANEVEVPSVGDRPSRLISQRMVGEILEPRARELFEMLRDNLRHSGTLEALCRRGGAERRRFAPGGNCRCCRIGVAASAAFVLADAVGKDALDPGGTRVCHGAGDGVLRPPFAHRARRTGHALEFALDGFVRKKGSITRPSAKHRLSGSGSALKADG